MQNFLEISNTSGRAQLYGGNTQLHGRRAWLYGGRALLYGGIAWLYGACTSLGPITSLISFGN